MAINMLARMSRGIAAPPGADARALLCAASRLERGGEHAGHIEPGLLGYLDKAGGARHVDFGQLVAYDIQADDEQPVRPQPGSKRHRDFPVARRKRASLAAAAGGEIAARFARLRN